MKKTFLLVLILLVACAPTAAPVPTPTPIRIQYTPATQSWLANLSVCAGNTPMLSEARAPTYFSPSADIFLRLGEPAHLTMPAFQIGTEDILVVVNIQNPLGGLTIDQVKELFSGYTAKWDSIPGSIQGDVHVWVYAPDEDVEKLFEQSTLAGVSIASTARLATSPQDMATAVGGDPNAIGVVGGHWKTNNLRNVYTATSVPVLAITSSKPQGAVAQVLACLQK